MESRTDAHYTQCAGLAVSFLLERGQRADTRACGKGRCRMQVLAATRQFRYRRRIRIQLHATFATRSATDNLRALRTDPLMHGGSILEGIVQGKTEPI